MLSNIGLLKWMRRTFFAIFKIPDTMLMFFSGILLSAAINIVTNGVTTDGFDWIYGYKVTIAMLLMFLSSIFFTCMAIYLKPIIETFNEQPKPIREGNKDKWYEVIKGKKGAVFVLSVFFLLTYVSLIVSIMFLLGDKLEVIWRNILSQKDIVIQTMN